MVYQACSWIKYLEGAKLASAISIFSQCFSPATTDAIGQKWCQRLCQYFSLVIVPIFICFSNMYIHMPDVADVINPYLLVRSRKSTYFALHVSKSIYLKLSSKKLFFDIIKMLEAACMGCYLSH